ncbi:DUF1003 domain-containing protein [Candidatus Pacearchaeota archaeon]|nr:DUF1003 domain-containing protein [Candidatus Pacearchaeota archaeon]
MEKEEKIKLKKEVLQKINHQDSKHAKTYGQRAADFLAKWAGSWAFIIGFFVFLIIWMILNIYFFVEYKIGKPWDPYPFILLNLCLSCLAAIQAPVILMSQNRTVQRDRLRAEYDYQVNKKAEQEIQEVKKQLNRIEKVMMKRKK